MRRATQAEGGHTALPGLLLLASVGMLVWLWLDRPPPTPDTTLEVGPAAAPAEPEHEYRTARGLPPMPPAPTDRASTPAPPPSDRPVPSALLARCRAEPGRYKALIQSARRYFDLDEEVWRGRKALLGDLTRHHEEGERFLATPDALAWLIGQARSFATSLRERKWQREIEAKEFKADKGVHHLELDGSRLCWSEPPAFFRGRARDWQRPLPRAEPAPLLVALHDGTALDEGPAERMAYFRRHYQTGAARAFASKAYVLMPSAPAGRYLDDKGEPKHAHLQSPLSLLWSQAHVDFDRMVLEGGHQAFAVATSVAVFFAGIVFRGGWSIDERHEAEVRNFASRPVYVIDDEALAKELRDAGHPDVVVGTASERFAWIERRFRQPPKRFHWTAARPSQQLPYWINLSTADWRAEARCLEVEILDTEDAPNTIEVKAQGVDAIDLFLNDALVDLDRPVRLVVNGHVEHDARLPGAPAALAPLDRDLDVLFNRHPLQIRTSRYYGWLFPAHLTGIPVRPGTPLTCGVASPAVASDAEEPAPPVAEFLPTPEAPPAVDPGEPELGAPQESPSPLDWRWVLAGTLAVLALLLWVRRRSAR